MRVVLSKLAELDLLDIGDFIALDNPVRAQSFVDELVLVAMKLGDTPYLYRARPELASTLRSMAYRGYVFFYRVRNDSLQVERILHGARNASDLLL